MPHSGAEERNRTSTIFRSQAPRTCAAAVTPLPQNVMVGREGIEPPRAPHKRAALTVTPTARGADNRG